MSPSIPSPMKFGEINWSAWVPKDRATLTFIIRDGHVLLIHKKRGLGAGKINGPGGRLEPGETPLACAIREVQEEVLVTPVGVVPRGVLRFQFADGYSIEAHVFTATGAVGTPGETDEARPEWFSLQALPYDRMWADDRLWMPLLLEGRFFDGRFLFDGDAMLGHDVREGPPPA